MRLTARGRRFLLGLILTIGLLIMVTGAMQVFVDRAVTARCGDLVADPNGWVARFWHDAVTA